MARFLSQEVPASLAPGATARVRIVMQNAGTEAWTPALQHRLGSQAPMDNGTWGFGRVEVPAAGARAGAVVPFVFDITSPANPGTYGFQWGMLREGVEWFGDRTPLVRVGVQ